MKWFIFFLVVSLLFISLTNKADAQANLRGFELNSTGVSHIYWPFPDSFWKNKSDWHLTPGSDFHTGSDRKSQDWNFGGGNADCGSILRSPISGTVIYAGHVNINVEYGEQVVIRSDTNDTFAFRFAHLIEGSIPFEVGDHVRIGDIVGELGNTGYSTTCHTHSSLYRNLDAQDISILENGGFLTDKKKSARFKFNALYIDNCGDGQFRAEYFKGITFGGSERFVHCTNEIDYDWEDGSIGGINARNKVSVRWTGNIPLEQGVYEFTTLSDDGVRLYIDQNLVIDDWNQHLVTENKFNTILGTGTHEIILEYFEWKDDASVSLDIRLVAPINTVPQLLTIPDQSINTGEQFTPFDLDSFLVDPDIGDTFAWEVTGNQDLEVNIDQDNIVTLTYPENTAIDETLTFKVTDAANTSAMTTATFVVDSCDITVAAGNVGAFVLAIDSANSNPDHTVICLTAGAPYLFSTVHNQTLGQNGLGNMFTPITIDGRGAAIQRDLGPNVGMRFFLVSQQGKIFLRNMTVSTGVEVTNTAGGGALINDGGEVHINNVQFINNFAYNNGGGALMNLNGGSMFITNTEFVDNEARLQGSGGAIGNRGATSFVSLNNVKITSSDAKNIGGAIYNQGIFEITNSEIANNTATNDGGAIFNTGSVTAHQSCFTGNSANAVSNASGTPIDFTTNWWGASDGPGGVAAGSGDGVSANVTFTPFLAVQPAHCSN